jgi:hypothetical protein
MTITVTLGGFDHRLNLFGQQVFPGSQLRVFPPLGVTVGFTMAGASEDANSGR